MDNKEIRTLNTKEEQDEFIKELGSTLSRLRKEKKISQEDMAKAVGVSTNHVSSMERAAANSRMSIIVFYNFCAKLGISADELLRKVGNGYNLPLPTDILETSKEENLHFVEFTPIEQNESKDSDSLSDRALMYLDISQSHNPNGNMEDIVQDAQAKKADMNIEEEIEFLRRENALLQGKLKAISAILGIPDEQKKETGSLKWSHLSVPGFTGAKYKPDLVHIIKATPEEAESKSDSIQVINAIKKTHKAKK